MVDVEQLSSLRHLLALVKGITDKVEKDSAQLCDEIATEYRRRHQCLNALRQSAVSRVEGLRMQQGAALRLQSDQLQQIIEAVQEVQAVLPSVQGDQKILARLIDHFSAIVEQLTAKVIGLESVFPPVSELMCSVPSNGTSNTTEHDIKAVGECTQHLLRTAQAMAAVLQSKESVSELADKLRCLTVGGCASMSSSQASSDLSSWLQRNQSRSQASSVPYHPQRDRSSPQWLRSPGPSTSKEFHFPNVHLPVSAWLASGHHTQPMQSCSHSGFTYPLQSLCTSEWLRTPSCDTSSSSHDQEHQSHWLVSSSPSPCSSPQSAKDYSTSFVHPLRSTPLSSWLHNESPCRQRVTAGGDLHGSEPTLHWLRKDSSSVRHHTLGPRPGSDWLSARCRSADSALQSLSQISHSSSFHSATLSSSAEWLRRRDNVKSITEPASCQGNSMLSTAIDMATGKLQRQRKSSYSDWLSQPCSHWQTQCGAMQEQQNMQGCRSTESGSLSGVTDRSTWLSVDWEDVSSDVDSEFELVS